jgi:hypothetical protein
MFRYRLFLIIVASLFVFCVEADAGRGGSHSHSSKSYRSHATTHVRSSSSSSRTHYSTSSRKKYVTPHVSTGKHRASYSSTATRDSHGRIKRSESAKRDFKKQTGYPHGRPGYVIDHVVPLSRGGPDSPSNMQWQTKADAKAKDKWERGPPVRKKK